MGIDFSKMDKIVRRQAKVAQDAGCLYEGTTERLSCLCGFKGTPLAIIDYSEWDEADDDRAYSICPNCGDM